MSYSNSVYFENTRSNKAKLFRAIGLLLPESVEKILAKKNVVIQDEDWDALRVIADQISLPYVPILDNKEYEERYNREYSDGLNILEQLLKYGAINCEDCSYYSALEIFSEKGLVECVELCLKYGLKLSLNELYVACKYVDLSLFKLFGRYGLDFKYNQPQMKYFSDCPIEILHEEPQKNTWGRIKSLEGYLDDKTISLSAGLCHKLDKLIYKKKNLCTTKEEQKQCSMEMNELQKEHYYDRLEMMKGILELIKANDELLKNESVKSWKEYIDNYEDELKECFESSSNKRKKVMIKDIRALIISYYCKEKFKETNTVSDDDIKFIMRVYNVDEVNSVLSSFNQKYRNKIADFFDLWRGGRVSDFSFGCYLRGLGFDDPENYKERKDRIFEEIFKEKTDLFDRGLINKFVYSYYINVRDMQENILKNKLSKLEEIEIKEYMSEITKNRKILP